MIDNTGCLGSTIKVAAGHYVDLENPDPSTIEIGSIAAALSKVCRFGGHCPKFYSVAEHCVHATRAAVEMGFVGNALVAILLHDATEAYVGDMVKPLKNTLPQYMEAEKRFEDAIGEAFGIDFTVWKNTIKLFDNSMLKSEKMVLWPDDHEEWGGLGEIERAHVELEFWLPEEAEEMFLAMAITLGIE